MPPVSREIITDCLAFTGALAPQIDRLDGEVRARAKADPRVKILTALPGVGQYTALVMLAETGDITRFPNARKLASWAGLTPTVRGSDLTVRHGHISKMACAEKGLGRGEWEVRLGGGRRAGSAQGSADIRLRRLGHRGILAGADVASGPGEPARVAAPVRHPNVELAVEGCTGWRYVVEELRQARITAHLAEPAEPAETASRRGSKRRSKDGLG